jgi:hypothetical protein
MKNSRKNMKEIYKNLTQNQKDKMKLKIQNDKKEELKEQQLQKRILNKRKKEEFKKLPKDEQTQIIQEIKKAKHIEFPYLDELNEEQLNNLKQSNQIVIDPGKRILLYMMDNTGKILRYTNKQRLFESKRLKYSKLLQNYKNKNNISQIENSLKDYNSKSCDLTNFKSYISKKNEINKLLFKKYKNPIFRQYKWYGYMNKQRSEGKLINRIKQTFGDNSKIIIGDWGTGKHMRNFISTPMIGLKRKLKEHFDVYNVDEHRTSCLHYKTETKCENLYLLDKTNTSRRMHSILTAQLENQRLGCINRDKNSCKNILKLVNYWLESGSRPLKYQRGYNLSESNKILKNNPILLIKSKQKKPLTNCQIAGTPNAN